MAENLKNKTIVHILTGSIAAYKAPDLITALRGEGARVVCVMTDSAKQFITSLTIRAVSGERVYDEFFTSDTPYDVLHTSLADMADLILVSPTSADFIAKMAGGFANDLASCIVLAAKRPVLIAPAMNDQMYEHPITQKNIETLKNIGYAFVDPIQGHLVCGKEAMGHISEPQTIVAAVVSTLAKKKS